MLLKDRHFEGVDVHIENEGELYSIQVYRWDGELIEDYVTGFLYTSKEHRKKFRR